MLTDSKIHYKRNMLISIILSELLIIALFVLSPKEFSDNEKILYEEPVVLSDEVPRTVQSLPAHISKPEVPVIYISDEPESFKILEDVTLSSELPKQDKIPSMQSAERNDVEPVRSAPRQIFEVIPANGNNEYAGSLQLSLKISDKGQVVDHRILSNSLDCTDCLNDIIKAVYRSKWEPALVNGKNTDYWVMKSYIFN